VDLGREYIGFEDKRSRRIKTQACSRGVEQEHMVISGGNESAKEVGNEVVEKRS